VDDTGMNSEPLDDTEDNRLDDVDDHEMLRREISRRRDDDLSRNSAASAMAATGRSTACSF